MRAQPACSLALVSLLVGVGLAGCFDDRGPQGDDTTFSISRGWRLDLDNDAMRRLEGAADPFQELESILHASLTIRVGSPGDYTLSYTTRLGETRNETLSGLQPGVAHVVREVDPFAGARLTRGDETIAERQSVPFTGFAVGDVPLGARTAPGGASSYAYSLDVHTALQAAGLDGTGDIDLESVDARVDLPLRGTINWTASDAGADGTRIDVNARVWSDTLEGGIARALIEATTEGGPLTGGFEVPALGLAADGAATFWFQDNRLAAAQSQGAGYAFAPTVYLWADGADAARFGQECAGKTRADACEPADLPRVDERVAPGERETMDGAGFEAETSQEQRALRFMERLFALDMASGDEWVLAYAYDSSEDQYDRSDFRFRITIETRVVSREQLAVRAGTFDALKVAQSARLQVDADSLSEYTGYDVETGQSNYSEVARGLDIDETVARQTFWLHAETFAPLKLEAETPVDADALLTRVMGSLTDAGWDSLGFQPIAPDDLTWNVNALVRAEAVTLDTQARFAPAVGMGLATALTGSGSMVGMTGFLFPSRHYAEAVPEPRPYPAPTMPTPGSPYPADGMSLIQTGPVVNGSARLMVEHVANATWSDLRISVMGAPRDFAVRCESAADNATVFVCRGEEAVASDEPVWSRDVLYVGGVSPGDVVEVHHVPSGATWWAGKLAP